MLLCRDRHEALRAGMFPRLKDEQSDDRRDREQGDEAGCPDGPVSAEDDVTISHALESTRQLQD